MRFLVVVSMAERTAQNRIMSNDFVTITMFSVTSFDFYWEPFSWAFRIRVVVVCLAYDARSDWGCLRKFNSLHVIFGRGKSFRWAKVPHSDRKRTNRNTSISKKTLLFGTKTLNYLFAIICLPWSWPHVSISTLATRTVRLFHFAAFDQLDYKRIRNLH